MPRLTLPRDSFSWGLLLLWIGLQVAYIYTAPAEITFEDTPLFAGACATLGLPHPPGYPLYVWTCFPLTRIYMLFGLSPALGATAMSALSAATACVVLALLLRRVTANATAALLAAGLLGLSQGVWDQAQIPEVYALNLLLLILSWYVCQRLVEGGGLPWLRALALVTGLGLANHWPLFMLSIPALLCWLGPAWPRLVRLLLVPRALGSCLLLLALGLVPYLHLLLVGGSGGYMFDPNYTAADFVPYVAREVYGLGGLPIAFAQRLDNAFWVLSWFVPQFLYLGGVLVVIGLVWLGKERRWWQLAGVLWGVFGSTALLALVRPFEHADALSLWLFQPYPLPAYAFATVGLAVGLGWLMHRFGQLDRGEARFAVLVVLGVIGIWQLPDQDRRNDTIAVDHARLVLERLPADTLLLTPGSDFDFALDYANVFEQPRPDLSFAREQNFFSAISNDGVISPADERKLSNEKRPIAYILDLNLRRYGSRFRGTHFELDTAIEPGRAQLDLDEAARRFLLDVYALRSTNPRNAFTAQFVSSIIISFVVVAETHLLHGEALAAEDRALLQLLANTPEGRFGQFLAFVLKNPTPPQLAEVEDKLITLRDVWSEMANSLRVDALHMLATLRILAGNLEGGTTLLHAALQTMPSASNYRVIIDLLQIYATEGDFAAYEQLRRRFPGLGKTTALTGYDSRCELVQLHPCTP